MKYWIPDLCLATQLPPQTSLQDKLGGLPWGLPSELWPRCQECGHPQSLLAQFVHHQERLDLGAPDRVLFVFQCNYNPGVCATWERMGGANACFILSMHELTHTLTPLPRDDIELEIETRIEQWIARDDHIPSRAYTHFFHDAGMVALPEAVRQQVMTGTRLGSVPAWIQSAEEGPPNDWHFVGQLDSTYSFYTSVPAPDAIGCQVGREEDGRHVYAQPTERTPGAPAWVMVDGQSSEGRTWFTHGPNFGDGGIGYIFIRTTPKPEGQFFWQCG
jgi:hypothetical protein